MISIKQFYLNELRECCYILWDQTKECVIVDPGISSKSEENRIIKFITENNLTPVKLLLTHGHFDHVMGCAFICNKYQIPIYIHPKDKMMLSHAKQTCQMFGYNIDEPPTNTIDINDGDFVDFGNSKLEVINTPGHTWGSVCFYSKEDKFCLTGDTMFAGNCGRTDLPEGDNSSMYNSLINIIPKKLAPDTDIYAGHGTNSTMAEELANNPYLNPKIWI